MPPAVLSSGKSLEPTMSRLEQYTLFETATYYYVVASDAAETNYKVLKLDRCVVQPKSLGDVLQEDINVYDKEEMSAMINMINEGNKTSGGLTQVATGYGLVGFVRFLDCYYFTLITQRKKVGAIANNDIYAVKSAEVFAIRPKEQMEFSLKSMWNSMKGKINRATVDTAESRYLGLFQFIDISKDFFFSYSYDLTHSMQFNYNLAGKAFPPPPCEEMFEWSRHQSEEMRECLGDLSAAYWVLPIIHGSFQQRRFDLFGKTLDISLIARRSRHYAGTRYLKRGISVHGKVANDCEMEQIMQLSEGLKSTFASFVQVRGSIPTYWYQETSVTMPKPPILVNRIDPTYLATQAHCADLLTRYGAPIIVLDLVKQAERRKRESLIGKEFRQAMEVVNLTIPDSKKIRYVGLDFSRMSKAAKQAHMVESKRKGSDVVIGAGSEWSNFEKSMGNEVLDKKQMSSNNPTTPTSPTGAEVAQGATVDSTSRIDVLRELKVVAAWTLAETAFFCSSTDHVDVMAGHITSESRRLAKENGTLQQSGVLRTNCIDCLDRTNVGQFAAGACFLTHGMAALGLLNSPDEEPSSGLLLGVMDMYSEMGDKIALQYGGSNAHKKVSGNSKGGAQAGAKSGSKPNELLTSIKRYYSNAFTDRLKQDAMNLFLGYFIPSQSDSPLWDLETDYFMHNKILRPLQPVSYTMLYNLNSFVQQHYGRGDFRDNLVAVRRSSNRDPVDGADKANSTKGGGNSNEKSENSSVGFVNVDFVQSEMEDIMINIGDIINSYLIKEISPGTSNSRRGSTSAAVQYLCAENINAMSAEEREVVFRHEKRKLVLQQKQVMLNEAYQMWWKEALNQHFSKQKWMCLSTPEASLVTPYFNRVHETSVMTSFDEKLQEEYLYPFDGTIAGSAELEDGNLAPEKQQGLARSISRAVPTAVGDIRQDSISLTLTGAERRKVAGATATDEEFQFSLSKFVLDIGKQATKAMVDGIMGRGDDELLKDTVTNRQKFSLNKNKKKKFKDATPHWKDSGEESGQTSIRNLIDLPISEESIRVYSNCEEKAKTPEDFIYAKDLVRKKDFDQLLKSVTVSADDVYGMENLARDSIVCDTVKDGIFLGMSRDTDLKSAYEKIFTNLIFVESEIVDFTMPMPISSKKVAASVAEKLAAPAKPSVYYTDVVRSSVIHSPVFSDDDENFYPTSVGADSVKKAARAAANFSKSLKNVGAAAISSPAPVQQMDSSEHPMASSANAGVRRKSGDTGSMEGSRDDASDDSDDDDVVVLSDVGGMNKPRETLTVVDPINTFTTFDNAPEMKLADTVLDLDSNTTPHKFISAANHRELHSPDGIQKTESREKRSSTMWAPEGSLIMNNFLTTPSFEKSAETDMLYRGEKSVVEMLDIPHPAKNVLTKIASASVLTPGIEEEMYKLIANYMFQHTMYARTISIDRLSRRLSTFTAQADLLQYSSLFSIDELSENLDTIMFMASSESTGRFYELDHLRRSLKSRHEKYLKEVDDVKAILGFKSAETVAAAIAALENKKAELMEQSTALAEFLKHLKEEKDKEEEFKKSTADPKWYVCPDSVPEEFLSKFTQIQSDLYQKKDNEYVIANSVAMMSYYSFHNQKAAEVWN